jgi:hypothetical protein
MTTALDLVPGDQLRSWLFSPAEAIHRQLDVEAQRAITTELGRILARQRAVALAAECDNALPRFRERIGELESQLPGLQKAIDAAAETHRKALQNRKAAAGTRQEDMLEHAEHLAFKDLDTAQTAHKITAGQLADTREKLRAVEGLRDKLAAMPEPDMTLLRDVLAVISPEAKPTRR